MHLGDILIGLLILGTLVALIAGVVLMSIGGKLNTKYGNRMMVIRVSLQGLVLMMLVLLFSVGHK